MGFRSEAMGCGDAQLFADFVVFDANARSIRGMHNLLLITSSLRTTRAVQPSCLCISVAQLPVRFSAWLARFQQLYSQRFQASLQQLYRDFLRIAFFGTSGLFARFEVC